MQGERQDLEEDETKMDTKGTKRPRVEEYEEVVTREGQRNRKREKKASPLYYTYRPLISDDQDKSPTTATVNDTSEATSVHNEGSYQRARKYVGEDKWGIARERENIHHYESCPREKLGSCALLSVSTNALHLQTRRKQVRS